MSDRIKVFIAVLVIAIGICATSTSIFWMFLKSMIHSDRNYYATEYQCVLKEKSRCKGAIVYVYRKR